MQTLKLYKRTVRFGKQYGETRSGGDHDAARTSGPWKRMVFNRGSNLAETPSRVVKHLDEQGTEVLDID